VTARPIDGAEGYRFYRRHDGSVQLEETNEYLRGIGMREVKSRMLRHYRKLERYGYASYVTQNRLDLAVAGDTGWLEDMLARYGEIAQTVPGEVLIEGATHTVSVEGLGLVTASVVGDFVPSAGTSLVLRLVASGIERTAVVVRTDRDSGRFHLRFDLYSSVGAASGGTTYEARIRVTLSPEAETMAAVSDVMLRLDRAISKTRGVASDLVRVNHVSLESPLEIIIAASTDLLPVTGLLVAVTLARKQWYEGIKADREGEGFAIDNEMKRRALQLEVDAELEAELEKEAAKDADSDGAEDSATLRIREAGGEAAYGLLSRREFFGAAISAIALPVELEAEDLGEVEPS